MVKSNKDLEVCYPNSKLGVSSRKVAAGWLKIRNSSNIYRLTSVILMLLNLLVIQGKAQSLEEYQQIAAEQNPGLQAKYKRFEAAMQRVTQVSILPDPNLSFGYFISPVETRLGPQRARISLSQMFPWFGTLKAQKDAESLLTEAKYQEFLDARNKLFYQVSAAYYPLYELHRLTAIEKENIAILTSYKDISTVKFQNGKGTMVDVLRVDIMLKEASTNLSILNQKEKPLITQFSQLLNRKDGDPVLIPELLSTMPTLEEGYRRDSLLIDNPKLDELELKIRASEANKQTAIRQGLPKLGVGLDYVMIGQRTDMDVPDNGKDAVMPMVTMSLPIFRAKYRSAQKEAQLMQESFSFQKEEMINQLTSDYEMIWFDIQKQVALLQLYEQQSAESNQSLNLLLSAYSNTGKAFEEVLQMQQQLLEYKKLKVNALAKYHTAIAELDYITAKSR